MFLKSPCFDLECPYIIVRKKKRDKMVCVYHFDSAPLYQSHHFHFFSLTHLFRHLLFIFLSISEFASIIILHWIFRCPEWLRSKLLLARVSSFSRRHQPGLPSSSVSWVNHEYSQFLWFSVFSSQSGENREWKMSSSRFRSRLDWVLTGARPRHEV